MNATIRGRGAIWGIETTAGDTFAAGLIKSQKHGLKADTDEIRDNQGYVVGEVFFNQNDECDVEILAESATTPPAPGSDIQLAGLDCIVQDSQVNWEQKGWKSLQVKAKKFVNLVP